MAYDREMRTQPWTSVYTDVHDPAYDLLVYDLFMEWGPIDQSRCYSR